MGNLVISRIMCLHELHSVLQGDLSSGRKMAADVSFASLRMLTREQRSAPAQRAGASSEQTLKLLQEEIRDSPGGFEEFNRVVLEFFDKHAAVEFDTKLGAS